MLHRLSGFDEFSVWASDGELGTIHSFYFDVDSWIVRYIIIDSEDSLGRRLLVATKAIEEIDIENQAVTLTPDLSTLKNSPDLGIEQPPTRDEEAQLHSYFQMPMYWAVDDESLGTGNMASLPMIELIEDIQDQSQPEDEPHELRLRSTREVVGYEIKARDGDVGRLEDLIVDDEEWRVLYLIVDTREWLSDKKVLVSPGWIERVGWLENEIVVDLEKDTVHNSPALEDDTPLNRNFETRIYDHYGKNKYWDDVR